MASRILCMRLLYSAFGEEVGAVGTILLERGRLSFDQLRNLLPDMAPSQIARCLGVLIQQNCVFHSNISVDESRAEGEAGRIDYYEASLRDILARLRFGRVMALHKTTQLTKDEGLGEELPLPLVELLLLHGKLRLGTLLDMLTSESGGLVNGVKEEEDDHVNGIVDRKGKGKAKANSQRLDYLDVVRRMLAKRFLRVVTPRQMMSDADRELKQEREILSKAQELHGRLPTAKQIKDVRDQVEAGGSNGMTAKEESDEEYELAVSGSKRKAATETNGRHSKRFRADVELNEDCYLRINVDRYMTLTRDAWIKKAVAAKYGSHARDMISAFLVCARNGDEDESEGGAHKSRSVSTAEICQQMKATSKKAKASKKDAFVDECPASRAYGNKSGTWKRDDDETAIVRELCELICGSVLDEVEEGTEEAAQSSPLDWHKNWMEAAGDHSAAKSGHERWRLNFGAIAGACKHALFEDLVMRRFAEKGKTACRLVNIIAAKGHVDEKHISKYALVPAKEVRTLLSELASHRLIESQEVSRSKTDRSRSSFYYYVEPHSWQTIILNEVYQALSNLATRMDKELHDRESLMARLARADVDYDASRLGEVDQQELGRLNLRLEYLKTAMERADEDRYLLETAD